MKVAIYCRLSEEDRDKRFEGDDSMSIKNQKAMLIGYANERGWEVYKVYSDDDYTGSDRNRPQFKRLINDARERRFDIILCKTQSRFTRELELVEKYIHGLFPKLGIRFIGVVDNADTENKGNKKSRQINGLVNEWYLEDMSENIKSVLNSRRKNGFHIGSFALYGYEKDPYNKGHLIIDKEAALIVKEVFKLFSEGFGKEAIAKLLNERGIPNPTEYKRQRGLRYKPPKSKYSTYWRYSAISSMLKNEMYIGNMVQGRYGSISYKTKENKPRKKEDWYIVEGTHEAIIDIDLWNNVQRLIKERSKPFKTGEVGIFSGKARCSLCGGNMTSAKSHGSHYLKCLSHSIDKASCVGGFISVNRLEEMVVLEINLLIKEYFDLAYGEGKIKASLDIFSHRDLLVEKIKLYTNKADKYKKYIREAYIDKIKGLIGEDDYKAISEEFLEKYTSLEDSINNYNKSLAIIDRDINSGKGVKEVLERYKAIDGLNYEIVNTLIDYIAIGKRIKGSHKVPIKIHWSF